MGTCLSAPQILASSEGDETAYMSRYLEQTLLGEGQFGEVMLAEDLDINQLVAVKKLKKGVVFKDNVLYSPMKPKTLQQEIDILKILGGNNYCLKLSGVFESKALIWLVTEFCSGGELIPYVSEQEDLTMEDVARISRQYLKALAHMASHNILHRDIKPENTMFVNKSPGADLRLIDFGCGRVSDPNKEFCTTFAGTPFYTSPELYQKKYNDKTDIWSVGVCLYVLVAGYPSDVLQKAFNKLQNGRRNLRELPHMPDDIPDTFYDLLEATLIYEPAKRPSAQWILDNIEFVAKPIEQPIKLDDVAAEANLSVSRRPLSASVQRHSVFLDYTNYERSLTSLLATLLAPNDLDLLVEKCSKKEGEDAEHQQKLNVIRIDDLKAHLETMEQTKVLEQMEKLPNSTMYTSFSYHLSLLQDFQRGDPKATASRARSVVSGHDGHANSVHGSNVYRRSASVMTGGSVRGRKELSGSWHGGEKRATLKRSNTSD